MAFGEIMQRFTWEILDANSWLLVENDCGLLFDPVDSSALYGAISGLKELLIVLTHCHFDHICGLNHIRNIRSDACVIATSACSERICRSSGNLSNIANVLMAFHKHNDRIEDIIDPFSCKAADRTFQKELDIEWQNHKLRLEEYNGHSRGGLCCEIDGSTLITGDTLLPIPTITRLPGGSTRAFWEEDMPRLTAMKERIKIVCPGHGEPGQIDEMLSINKR